MDNASDRADVYAVIMAGGSGERFWPLSTSARPKQFLDLIGGKSLLAQAVERLQGLIARENICIVTAERLVEETRRAVPDLPVENIAGEPCRRDTAAAVAAACGLVRRRSPDAVICILTADHLMADIGLFRETLADACDAARHSASIVTIGIKPAYPATGYGYIEAGEKCSQGKVCAIRKVRRFVEKPCEEKAKEYVGAGTFLWNSGMFIFKVSTMMNAFRQFTPQLAELADELATSGTPAEVLRERYSALKPISIDYAVMEKAGNILVAEGDFGWDDVGTWQSVSAHFPADDAGNVLLGRIVQKECKDNLVVGTDGRLLALLGVEGLCVVQTEKATLVCPKEKAQRVKELLRAIAEQPGGADYL